MKSPNQTLSSKRDFCMERNNIWYCRVKYTIGRMSKNYQKKMSKDMKKI